jgi:hypothetical protein
MADELHKDPFTAEQSEKLNAMIGQTVNNMLVARLNTTEKKLLEKMTSTFNETLSAKLPELLKEFKPVVDDDGKGGKGKGGKADDAVEMATLRKQVQDLLKSNETERNARIAAEARRREMDRQRILVGELAKNGISDPFKQELAIAYLDRNKRVTWSGDEDDATLLWDDGVNPVSFNEGLASWFKGEEVKHFLPPAGTKGSGSGPAGRGAPPNQGGKPTKEQQFEIIGQSLKDALSSM